MISSNIKARTQQRVGLALPFFQSVTVHDCSSTMCAPVLSTVLRQKRMERPTKGKLWGQQDTISARCSMIPSNLFPVFNTTVEARPPHVSRQCTTSPAQLLANLKSLKASYTVGKLCFCFHLSQYI